MFCGIFPDKCAMFDHTMNRVHHFCACLLFLLISGISTAQAQHSLLSSGATAVHASGSVSYSVGQMNYTNATQSAGSLQQGVQQPWILLPSPVWEPLSDFNLTVFPNPAGNHLYLTGSSVPVQGYLELFSMQGSLLRREEIRPRYAAALSLQGLPSGSYFLKIYSHQTLIHTATLIKSL
jgi:hypothetical protein